MFLFKSWRYFKDGGTRDVDGPWSSLYSMVIFCNLLICYFGLCWSTATAATVFKTKCFFSRVQVFILGRKPDLSRQPGEVLSTITQLFSHSRYRPNGEQEPTQIGQIEILARYVNISFSPRTLMCPIFKAYLLDTDSRTPFTLILISHWFPHSRTVHHRRKFLADAQAAWCLGEVYDVAPSRWAFVSYPIMIMAVFNVFALIIAQKWKIKSKLPVIK